MNVTAFLSYVLLSTFTPGPNNIMSMSNASKHGFKKGFRFNIGVLCGFLMIMTLCAAFSGLLYTLIPQIEPLMLIIGTCYILWLAWTIWRDNPHSGNGNTLQSNTILSGMVLQFVNVKVILYGITVISTFILPYYRSIPALAVFVVMLALTGFVSTCCWAVFGAVFEKFFGTHRKILNTVMALLLVYCAISQLASVVIY